VPSQVAVQLVPFVTRSWQGQVVFDSGSRLLVLQKAPAQQAAAMFGYSARATVSAVFAGV
jgi:hypothetical protein